MRVVTIGLCRVSVVVIDGDRLREEEFRGPPHTF